MGKPAVGGAPMDTAPLIAFGDLPLPQKSAHFSKKARKGPDTPLAKQCCGQAL